MHGYEKDEGVQSRNVLAGVIEAGARGYFFEEF